MIRDEQGTPPDVLAQLDIIKAELQEEFPGWYINYNPDSSPPAVLWKCRPLEGGCLYSGWSPEDIKGWMRATENPS